MDQLKTEGRAEFTVVKYTKEKDEAKKEMFQKIAESVGRPLATKSAFVDIIWRSCLNGIVVDSVYAVGKFDNRVSGSIDGGTAWACRAFYLTHSILCPQYEINLSLPLRERKWCGNFLPLYFNGSSTSIHSNLEPAWFKAQCGCQYASNDMSGLSKNDGSYDWFPLEADSVPLPEGKYAGIGSRNMTVPMAKAIDRLYRRIEENSVQSEQ
jgi:hypothetical protein